MMCFKSTSNTSSNQRPIASASHDFNKFSLVIIRFRAKIDGNSLKCRNVARKCLHTARFMPFQACKGVVSLNFKYKISQNHFQISKITNYALYADSEPGFELAFAAGTSTKSSDLDSQLPSGAVPHSSRYNPNDCDSDLDDLEYIVTDAMEQGLAE